MVSILMTKRAVIIGAMVQIYIGKLNKMKNIIIVISVFLFILLNGCATKGSLTANGGEVVDPISSLAKGEIRLTCELSCSGAWGWKRPDLKKLHDSRSWYELANTIIDIGHKNTLPYYYLGRAAEGMGYIDAASVYYKLAKIDIHCDLGICDGFKFPKDIDQRLAGLSSDKQDFSHTNSSTVNDNKPTKNIIHNDNISPEVLELIKSAENNNQDAQFELGVMYKNGDRVTTDYNEAKKWLEMAAEKGNALAQFNLGIMYKNGLGVTKNINEAKKWLEKAASRGDKTAKASLESMADINEKMQTNNSVIVTAQIPKLSQENVASITHTQEKIKELGTLADYGDSNAQYLLGEMYENGDKANDIKIDKNKALKFYKLSSNIGNFKASEKIAHIYQNVLSRPDEMSERQAILETIKWYKLSLKQGGQDYYSLCNIYSNLYKNWYKSIQGDYKNEAIKWCKASSDSGHIWGISLYRELVPPPPPKKEGMAMTCIGKSGYSNRNMIFVDCTNTQSVVNGLRNAWLLVRKTTSDDNIAQNCYFAYKEADQFKNDKVFFNGAIERYFVMCNSVLEFVHNSNYPWFR